MHRRAFLNTAAVAAAASLPGCTLMSPAAASILKAAPYIPAADPVFAAIERWLPLQAVLDAAYAIEDEAEIDRHWGAANEALTEIYEVEPTTPEGLIAIMVVMQRQDSVHLDIDNLDDRADALRHGLARLFRSAAALQSQAVQS